MLETARGGIVRRGLGYDRADVAVITNITDDHLGMDDIDTVEDLVEIKALVAEEIRTAGTSCSTPTTRASRSSPTGRAVRRPQAGHPLLRPVGRQPVWSSGSCAPAAPRTSPRTAGWSRRRGARTSALLPITEVAGSFDGKADYMIANALAAVAAARALGVPVSHVVPGAAHLRTTPVQPGPRLLVPHRDDPIVVDYAHNPAARRRRRRPPAPRVGARRAWRP